MSKRTAKLVSLISTLALVLVMMPAGGVSANSPIELDGLFHGHPNGDIDADYHDYVLAGQDPGRGDLYYYIENNGVDDLLYVAMVVGPEQVNDNVFGQDKAYTKTAGWNSGHALDVLILSDHFEFSLTCGTNYYRWQQDYVYDADPTAGFDWKSDTAGPDGNSSCVACTSDPPELASASSLEWSLENSSWTFDSWGPGADPTNPSTWKSVDTGTLNDVTDEEGWGDTWWNATYDWEWAMVYEARLNLDLACDGKSWIVEVHSAHNSPSKDDNEDVKISLYDWADAPDSYGTTRNATLATGPRHELIPGGPILGFTVDPEGDGLPDVQADGDDDVPFAIPGFGEDDEDGLLYAPTLVPGEWVTLYISGTAGAGLDAWIDLDINGTFDPSDQIADSDDPTNPFIFTGGQYDTITFQVPETMPLDQVTYGRFRISSFTGLEGGVINSGLTPHGEAPDGEVEDYWFRSGPTAVDLVSFTATGQQNAVLLEWETATEIDNLGFNLYRAESVGGPRIQVNSMLIPSKVPGSPVGATYEFLDESVEAGVTYYYWLEDVDTYGQATQHGPVTGTPAGVYRVFLPFVSH